MAEPIQERPIDVRSMPLWRKAEIVVGILRGKLRRLGGLPIVHSAVRIRASKAVLKFGKFCELHDRCVLSAVGQAGAPPAALTIGDKTSIWYGTVISARYEVSIGSHCAISWNCTILDNDMHAIQLEEGDVPRKKGDFVRIADHVWIGANSIVLKGVTIGENSVVAAGSIVTRDVPPNTLVAGQPAQPVKTIRGWR